VSVAERENGRRLRRYIDYIPTHRHIDTRTHTHTHRQTDRQTDRELCGTARRHTADWDSTDHAPTQPLTHLQGYNYSHRLQHGPLNWL